VSGNGCKPTNPCGECDQCAHDTHTDDQAVEPRTSIELIDFATVHEHVEEILDGLILPGRWTAFAAPAKAGKTTLEMFLTVELSEGRDPFDGTPIDPVTVLYVDAEMGRLDLDERLRALGHDPVNLTRWHATDMAPKLDTIPGGNALVCTAKALGAQIVVIDGLNGVVTGAEKDDSTWRALFECTIMPLKRIGIAIVTGDNLGKDKSLGPRGSSVKIDKPDAVILLARTEQGVKLTTQYRRTSAYAPEMMLSIDGTEGDQPITFRRTNTSWPPGTESVAALLDQLSIPVKNGRGRVRQALADHTKATGTAHPVRNEVLTAAISYRRNHPKAELNDDEATE
jgi:hypothetical protein